MTHWEGAEARECGDHRTWGYRAWCHACAEWCYPTILCRGCELPTLRADLSRMKTEGDVLRADYQRLQEQAEQLKQDLQDAYKTIRAAVGVGG